jgi:tripartite-type tricarboxylate transporter receptor subunit TctC
MTRSFTRLAPGMLAATLLASTPLSVMAQEDFPTKPITIIVGYSAGGGTDAFIRALAEPVSAELGQPVLVQNRPGAGGGVAATTVANAPADGYTMVATTSTTFTLEPPSLSSRSSSTSNTVSRTSPTWPWSTSSRKRSSPTSTAPTTPWRS